MTLTSVLLVLTGLHAESKILEVAPSAETMDILCAASDPGRARLFFAERLGSPDVRRLLSFGLAGGLAAGLPAGSIVVADRVYMNGAVYHCDAAWTRQLTALLPQALVGSVQGATTIAATLSDKQDLYQKHKALVCDMESPIVAEAAETYKLPFASLRVVCDPADFALPPAALLPLQADGTPQLSALIRSVMRAPRQLPALMALRRHYHQALRSLGEAARAVV